MVLQASPAYQNKWVSITNDREKSKSKMTRQNVEESSELLSLYRHIFAMGHLFIWVMPIPNQQDLCKTSPAHMLRWWPTCSWANPVPMLLPTVAPLLSGLRSFQPGINQYYHLPPIVPLFYSLTWGGLTMTMLQSVPESGRKLKDTIPIPFCITCG